MKLKRLALQNFKNYSNIEFDVDAPAIGIYGANGTGKTNLLDAIYYLSVGKSYLPANDKQNVRDGEDFFIISGNLESTGKETVESNIKCTYSASKGKRLFKNGSPYDRITEHIGFLPVIFIIPSDLITITGNREERRRFIDSALCQTNPDYLLTLIRYNRTLEQRNQQLKLHPDETRNNKSLIEVYNEQLSETGQVIYEERKRFTQKLIKTFRELYEYISGATENPEIRYVSMLEDKPFAKLLEENFYQDIKWQRTTTGVHRDELEFHLLGKPLKKFGSQGQQKSFLFALKLSLNQIYTEAKNTPPLLLLDDIGDRLDNNRLEKLINLITQNTFGQTFLTDTSADRLTRLFKGKSVKPKLITPK